ncbi:MAG: hypothetical protein VW076_00040 [Synechococcus sp.]
MAPAIKGDPDWDKDFLAHLEVAQNQLITGWKNCDFATAERAHEICIYMLQKLFKISRIRGQQAPQKKR